jgi:hypothetical protein
MATIQELQKAIDENRLDPGALNNDQYNAVEQLIQEGKLKSKPLADIQVERDDAAVKIARVRQIEEDPIKAARVAEGSGFDRSSAEFIGDVIGSITPLILFRKNILKAARGGQLLNKQTTNMERLAANLPDKMKFTKGVATRLARVGGTVERLAKSPIVGLEAASIAGGTVGAGLGSVAYDVTNEAVGDEIVAAMTDDLGEIPKKEIDQNITLNAMEAMKNAAMWNTGAALLTPFIAGPLGGLMSKLFGAKGARAKELAQFARDKSLPIPLMAAFKDGPLSDLGQNYFKTVGVFPFVSGTGRKAFEQAEQVAGREYMNSFLSFAPVVKTSALGESVLNQMYKTFNDNVGMYTAAYKRFDNLADIAGNPAIISLSNSRKVAREIIDELDQYYPGIKGTLEGSDVKAIEKLTNTNDALFAFSKFLNATGTDNITMKQYKGTMEMLNRAMENSQLKSGRELLYRLREGMENDLAGMAQNINKNALLSDSGFRATYDVTAGVTRNEAGEIVNVANPAAGEQLIKTAMDAGNAQADALMNANQTFSRIMSLYTKGGLADKLKRVDRNLFTQKALFGIPGKADFSREAFYETIEKTVFLNGDPGSVKTFRELVGADDLVINGQVVSKATEDGKLAYDIALNRYFFNTFFDSFDTSVTPGARSIFNEIGDDKFVRGGTKYAEDVLTSAARENKFPGLEISEVRKGVGQIDTTQIRFSPDDFAQFNINKFMNKLNIGEATADLGRLKLRRMLKSQDHYDQFIRFTDFMKSISDIPLADTATFLQRRFTLGSLGSVAGGLLIGGGSMAISPFAPVVFIALAKQFGKVLADPVALRLLNDALSPAEREAIAATGKITVAGEKRAAKSGIYRRIVPGKDVASVARLGFAKNRDAVARFLNYVIPETKDNPQLDLSKVDPQEIVDYLNNQPYEVPSEKGYQEKIPEKLKQETFPDQYVDPKTITEQEIAQGAQFYEAAKTSEVNTLDEIAEDTTPTDQTVSQDIQLAAPGGQPTPGTQMAQADLAQALFPRDELLTLAARRRNA